MPSNKPAKPGLPLPGTDAATNLEDYQAQMVRVLGPTIGGAALVSALGFPTADAFLKARVRNRLPVPTFAMEGRRGRFAATTDIAAWLWAQRQGAAQP